MLLKKKRFLSILFTTYYQKCKKKLQIETHGRYQNLSEEEKYKKQQYAHEWYGNLSEEEKGKKRQCGRAFSRG